MAKTDLTAEYLRESLNYNPDTGVFTWNSAGFGRNRSKPAGTARKNGYIVIHVFGEKYFAHRLAWLHTFGVHPESFIDHINGDPSDNRMCNLRLATSGENMQNRRSSQSNNQSGYLGVSRNDSKTPKWNARIRVGNKVFCLGSFDSPESAHQAYLEAKRSKHTFCVI